MLSYMGRNPVGVVIYQKHPTLPGVLEIRNISVSPDAHGRYIGSFLLRNTEIVGLQEDFPGIDTAMVDTKVTNNGMIGFLLTHGYEIHEVTDLYGDGVGLDAVLTKTIEG